MKKITAIVLLVCLFLNIIGYHIVFHVRKGEIKADMKKLLRLSDQNTEQFVFSLADKTAIEKLEWEGEDEFRLNGSMYDVIEKKIVNGKWMIRCVSDTKETELIKKYQDITKNDFGSSSRNKSMTLLQLIGSLYTLPGNDVDVRIISSVQVHFFNYNHDIPSAPCDVITPPPRFL